MDKEKVLEIARKVLDQDIDVNGQPVRVTTGSISDEMYAFANAIEAAIREECDQGAKLYRQLRAMHWNDNKLAVVNAADLKLGTMTYSLERLDDAIRNMGKEG